MKLRFTIALVLGCSWFFESLAAPTCEARVERHAVHISSAPQLEAVGDWFSRLQMRNHQPHITPAEVYGDHSFYRTLSSGWIFTLLRQQHGWSLRLYDTAGGVDMTSITPPYGGAIPNTRDIFGWHFRNRQNTGPNLGSVNAPQQFRPFAFATSLTGTGGFKPNTDPATVKFSQPLDDQGRGWLEIIDYGLNNLQPGQQANMNYLKFEACLSWPRSPEEIRHQQYLSTPEYLAEETELFGSCGLDLQRYRLQAVVTPRHLVGDLDGDGAADDLAQVVRISDGKKDLALCRAGTWLELLNTADSSGDFAHTTSALEQWQLVPADFAASGEPGGATQWPQADGDVLVLERIEKSMYLVFWQDEQLQAHRVFRLVEP